MKKIQKIAKPIEVDAHFKYRCPKCGYDHWISLNEAKTISFKIVCSCKKVFSPKRIKKIRIIYPKSKDKIADSKGSIASTPTPISTPVVEQQKNEEPKIITQDLLYKCLPPLIEYGFTKKESEDMLNKAYQIDQSGDCSKLVKLALKTLGVK